MDRSRDKEKEVELILKIKDGDRDAFTALFHRYYPELIFFIQRYITQYDTCENLLQELFLNIWINRNKLDPGGNIQSYLYIVARNKAIDYIRHQKVERDYLERYKIERDIDFESYKYGQDHQEILQEIEIDYKLLAATQAAISNLPKRMHEIFTLNRNEGLSYKEIAEVLGISVKTVETQLGRALKSLREELSDYFRD